jgi:hypothetical protein
VAAPRFEQATPNKIAVAPAWFHMGWKVQSQRYVVNVLLPLIIIIRNAAADANNAKPRQPFVGARRDLRGAGAPRRRRANSSPTTAIRGLPLSARPLGRDGRSLGRYVHKRIRGELGFSAKEACDPEALLNQGCHGSRYPACRKLFDEKRFLPLLRRRGRHQLDRRRPARPRAIDFGDRRPPPAG